MTDLNKYKKENKIENHQLLKGGKVIRKQREKKYTEIISITLSKRQVEAIDEIQSDTGAGRSEIIRRFLKKGGLLDE